VTARLLTTRAVAELLAVSPEFCRDHAAELGGIRLGGHPKGPLRFTERGVQEYVDRRRLQPPADAQARRRPGPVRGAADLELLPLPKGMEC
jgi:hypothetical protein